LHLLEVGFTSHLENVSSEIAKQIAATQSEAARHALAYGSFEETLLESFELIPNIQKVVRCSYDENGIPVTMVASDIYTNTTNNVFQSYLNIRDRDLKLLVQKDADAFKSEITSLSLETASRNFIKQTFERAYNEFSIFVKIFNIEPHWSTVPESAFAFLKSQHKSLVNSANLTPLATLLQLSLQSASLQTICNIVGWLTHEYLIIEYDDEETPFRALCREMSARMLTEHLWTFTDNAFEAEITKSITKAAVGTEELKIGPVVNGVASSNAFPTVKRALELLAMFDQAMPKERSVSFLLTTFKFNSDINKRFRCAAKG
jgi:conserved oligomeric Golgi complex subunit 3